MAIRFILDGYNIIKSGIAPSLRDPVLQGQRERLVSLLREQRPQGSVRNRVTIVFDGPADSPFSGETYRYAGNIEVVFSEGESADEKIEQLVQGNPRDVVVVTNDRGIRRRLGGSGAKIVTVAEFLARCSPPMTPPGNDSEEKVDTHTFNDINNELKKKWFK